MDGTKNTKNVFLENAGDCTFLSIRLQLSHDCMIGIIRVICVTTYFYHTNRAPRPKDAKFIEDDYLIPSENPDDAPAKEIDFRPTVQWSTVFVNLFIHLGFFVGFWQMITLQPKWQTYLYCKFQCQVSEKFCYRFFPSRQSLSSWLFATCRFASESTVSGLIAASKPPGHSGFSFSSSTPWLGR